MEKSKRIISLICVFIMLFTGFGALLQYAVSALTRTYTLTASDGNNYRVTVSFDGSSGIPSDAVLDVREIVKQGTELEEEYGI